VLNILNDYFWFVLAASGILMVISIVTRFKFAKVKKDKVLFTTYSIILLITTLLLLGYKLDFFK